VRLWSLIWLGLTAGCGGGSDRTVVVVGFRAEPGLAVPGQVMVSDDGETFGLPEPIGDGEWLTEVALAGDRFLAIGLSGGLWESDGRAADWTGRHLHDTWLDAISAPRGAPGVLFAAGLGAFWRSDDGGETFAEHEPPGLYFEDFAFVDAAVGAGVEGTLAPAGGTIWWTPDGGETWSARVAAPRALRAIAIAGDGEGGSEMWAAGDGGTVVVSTNAGLGWRDHSGPTRVEPPSDLTDIDFASDGAGWLVGTRGAARAYRGRELPEEQRWTNGSAGDYVLQGVFAVSRDEAYATGYRSFSDRGVVLRTRDGGGSWRVLAETPGIFWYSIAGRP